MNTAGKFGPMRSPILRLTPVVAAVLAGAACIGSIGDGLDQGSGSGDDSSTTTQACTIPSPGPAPLRRLTQSEYNNTVRDLLGDTTHPADSFPPDQQIGDFTNTATALTVPPLLAQAYQSAAEQLAGTAVKNQSTLLPCDPTKVGQDACAQSFIAAFGKRAYRRPLTADEQSGLFALYQTNVMGADFTNGIDSVIEAVLQSAPFLYRVEFGATAKAQGNVVPLTSYEMATRLSYLLWGSMPDDALFAAADGDQLVTADQIAGQARRMLADPKAKPAVEQFYAQWLTLNRIPGTAKDPKTYPEYTPTLQADMQQETISFVDWVMWQSDAHLSTLLSSSVSFLNADLAQVYGVTGVTGTAFQKVTMDPTQRSGLLTQLSLMTLLGKPDRSSPVLRGKFVREHLLCQAIAPPPQNIVITPPPVTPGVSTRQAFGMHDKQEPCHGCHVLMDPIGFGFENYDGVGKWRTTDQGIPVDSSCTLTGSDVDGSYSGAVALAHQLAQSQEVADCMAIEWFHYAMGRGDTPEDACSMQSTKDTFKAKNFDMKELLVALTQTDAFRYRPEVTP
jgi:hypothetical protein